MSDPFRAPAPEPVEWCELCEGTGAWNHGDPYPDEGDCRVDYITRCHCPAGKTVNPELLTA